MLWPRPGSTNSYPITLERLFIISPIPSHLTMTSKLTWISSISNLIYIATSITIYNHNLNKTYELKAYDGLLWSTDDSLVFDNPHSRLPLISAGIKTLTNGYNTCDESSIKEGIMNPALDQWYMDQNITRPTTAGAWVIFQNYHDVINQCGSMKSEHHYTYYAASIYQRLGASAVIFYHSASSSCSACLRWTTPLGVNREAHTVHDIEIAISVLILDSFVPEENDGEFLKALESNQLAVKSLMPDPNPFEDTFQPFR